jgi:hypothetical protein
VNRNRPEHSEICSGGKYDPCCPGEHDQNRIDEILKKYAPLWGIATFIGTFVGMFLLTVVSGNGLTFIDAFMFSALVGAIAWVVCQYDSLC